MLHVFALIVVTAVARAASDGPSLTLALCPASNPPASFLFHSNNSGLGVISSDSGNVCFCAPPNGKAGPTSLSQCEGAGSPLHPFEVGWGLSGVPGSPAASFPWFPNNQPPASGLCVEATAAGSPPALAPCSPGAASQQWQFTAASTISNAASNLCFSTQTVQALASSVFGSHMVFQRDVPADLWGFGATPGGVVTVSLSGPQGIIVGTIGQRAGADGSWNFTLPPNPAGTGYNISIQDVASGKVQLLEDVAFGEVMWCSGQSNLSGGNTPVAYAFNATEEIAASSNYPWIRLFTVGLPPGSPTPLAELVAPPRIPWSRAAPSSAGPFSATCWFTGKRIADALGPDMPIGLIESAFGGTSIQVWEPPEATATCGAPPSYPGGWPTAPSACWNSQTVPFSYNNGSLSMRISMISWYQGESNSLTSEFEDEYYACALPFLIQSLRTLFHSPSAHAAIVQLAPWASSGANFNNQVAELRQAQLESGDSNANISVITAVDGGDPFGPIGSIHPRRKKLVGDRLGASLLTTLFNIPTPFAGPRYASATNGGGSTGKISATLTFTAASPLVLIPPSPVGQFANSSVCPVGVSEDLCGGFMLQGDKSAGWFPATASITADNKLLLESTAGAGDTRAIASASGWSLWPISLLYSLDGMLPVFPWNNTLSSP